MMQCQNKKKKNQNSDWLKQIGNCSSISMTTAVATQEACRFDSHPGAEGGGGAFLRVLPVSPATRTTVKLSVFVDACFVSLCGPQTDRLPP